MLFDPSTLGFNINIKVIADLIFSVTGYKEQAIQPVSSTVSQWNMCRTELRVY